MSPQIAIVLFVIGVIALIAGIWLAMAANRDRKTFDAAQKDLDAQRQALGSSSRGSKQRVEVARDTAPAPVSDPDPELLARLDTLTKKLEAREAELQRQLGDVKEKLDAQKRKVTGLATERDALRHEIESAATQKPQTQVDQGVLVDMRMDLADALAQVEHYKSQLAKSPKRSTPPAKKDPHPPALDQPSQPEITRQIGADDIAASLAATGQTEEKLRALEQELRDLKKAGRSQDKRAMRDLDRQRRRADNNDKAFRVTQRELDAARARIKMLTLANSTSHDSSTPPPSQTPAHTHASIVVAVETKAPSKKSRAAELEAQNPAKVKVQTDLTPQADTAELAESLAVDASQSTLEVQAPMRNEDEHETIEFDPKLVEAVVKEAESASEPETPEAPKEPAPTFDANNDEHEDAGAHGASEPQDDDLPVAESASDLPAEQKTTPMPIIMDADTTFDDIPLADEAMSIDDAWSVFMDDHDESDE